jgi:O-antigen ligase
MDVEVMENQGMSVAPSVGGLPLQKEYRFAVLSGLALALVFGIAQAVGGGTPASLGFLFAVAAVLLLLSNPELALAALMVVFYVDYHVSLFSSAVWFTLLIAAAFVLHRRDFSLREFATPLSVPLLIYGLSVVPSLFNAVRPFVCIIKMYNMAAFLIAMVVTMMTVRSFDLMRKLTWVFVVMAAANAVHVISVAVSTGGREYGFAGVMFVDYAGVAVNAIALMALFSKGWRRVVLLLFGILIGMGLILTQTRNAWLSTGITLVISLAYLIRYPAVAGITRKGMIVAAVVGGIALAGLAGATIALNPKVGDRAVDITEANTVGTADALIIRNTLLTRMIIWDTSLNAVIAHPFIGVGIYGFIDASYQYCHLPKILYALYVRGNSPHIAYFEVLAETGLLGLTAFTLLVVALLRVASRTVREVSGLRAQRHAFIAFSAVVYVTVSMFFTDAWLWGQGAVLWGFIVGLMLANRKIRSASEEA